VVLYRPGGEKMTVQIDVLAIYEKCLEVHVEA
jgi:hypothetical protein